MDTIEKGRFEDTNKIFVPPKKFNFRIKEKNGEIYKHENCGGNRKI